MSRDHESADSANSVMLRHLLTDTHRSLRAGERGVSFFCREDFAHPVSDSLLADRHSFTLRRYGRLDSSYAPTFSRIKPLLACRVRTELSRHRELWRCREMVDSLLLHRAALLWPLPLVSLPSIPALEVNLHTHTYTTVSFMYVRGYVNVWYYVCVIHTFAGCLP